jgi:hypothetical protein
MSKQILDIASLDAKLFEAVQNAYDETEELEHIRDMLIEGTEEREHPINDILESFVSYADDELKDIKVSLLPSTRYAP